jgi:anti-sigma factor RsiW
MTGCELPLEMLSAYVDGQLETDDELQVRRHLDGCAQCRDLLEGLSALNDAAASTSEVHPLPHSLRERLNRLGASRERHSGGWFWTIPALAAVVFLALALVRSSQRSNANAVDQLALALVEDHARYLEIPDGIQVASDDPAQVSASFRSRLGFSATLPQLSNTDLLGGRFCWLQGHKALLAFYRSDGKRLSVFVLDREDLARNHLQTEGCRIVGGYRVCLFPRNAEVIAMVAQKGQADRVFGELKGD